MKAHEITYVDAQPWPELAMASAKRINGESREDIEEQSANTDTQGLCPHLHL